MREVAATSGVPRNIILTLSVANRRVVYGDVDVDVDSVEVRKMGDCGVNACVTTLR